MFEVYLEKSTAGQLLPKNAMPFSKISSISLDV